MSYYHDISIGVKNQTPTEKKKLPKSRKAKGESLTKNAEAQLQPELGENQDRLQNETVAAAGIVCQGQPKAGLALQQKHPNVSWTNFEALVKRTTLVNNNFKNRCAPSSLQPMKVPGSEHLENCWHVGQQRQSRVESNHSHHGYKKGTKSEGGAKQTIISQKLRCASCGDMPWARWIGPNPGSWK